MAKGDRERKRGRHKVAEAERIAGDAAAWLERGRLEAPALFDAAPILPDDDKPAELERQGKAGRPVGARATAPQEYRRYILATHGDHLARLVRIANLDTIALARALGCTPLEAIRLQLDISKAAAPYTHQPQPRSELERAADYFAGMLFASGSSSPAIAGADRPAGSLEALAALAGRPPDMQEIQAISPVEFVGSEPAHSEPPDDSEEKAP